MVSARGPVPNLQYKWGWRAFHVSYVPPHGVIRHSRGNGQAFFPAVGRGAEYLCKTAEVFYHNAGNFSIHYIPEKLPESFALRNGSRVSIVYVNGVFDTI